MAENYINTIWLQSVPKCVSLAEITSATKEDKAVQLIFKIIKKQRLNKTEVQQQYVTERMVHRFLANPETTDENWDQGRGDPTQGYKNRRS